MSNSVEPIYLAGINSDERTPSESTVPASWELEFKANFYASKPPCSRASFFGGNHEQY